MRIAEHDHRERKNTVSRTDLIRDLNPNTAPARRRQT